MVNGISLLLILADFLAIALLAAGIAVSALFGWALIKFASPLSRFAQ
jgi:hypothetical protein